MGEALVARVGERAPRRGEAPLGSRQIPRLCVAARERRFARRNAPHAPAGAHDLKALGGGGMGVPDIAHEGLGCHQFLEGSLGAETVRLADPRGLPQVLELPVQQAELAACLPALQVEVVERGSRGVRGGPRVARGPQRGDARRVRARLVEQRRDVADRAGRRHEGRLPLEPGLDAPRLVEGHRRPLVLAPAQRQHDHGHEQETLHDALHLVAPGRRGRSRQGTSRRAGPLSPAGGPDTASRNRSRHRRCRRRSGAS